MKVIKTVFGCGLFTISCLVPAQEIRSTSFTHQNWEIYCSNTGTCRAAGYQEEKENNLPASLLLVRHAGAKQPVTAEFALSDYDQRLPASQLKNIHLYINGKDMGQVIADDNETPVMGNLSKKQVNVILQQASQHVEITFKNKELEWHISDAGMTAVLLKMDDFQKRIGTVGALVKKGKADESSVLAAQPKLVVKKVNTATTPYRNLQSGTKQYQTVYRSLIAAQPMPKEDDFCEGTYSISEKDTQSETIQLYKLSGKKVLAMMRCWRGAYNEGYGAWVMDETLTGKATFVTESASEVEEGGIFSSQKGRGLGDCWASAEWIWNGEKFIQVQDRWSGMCKGLAAGGVWDLDKIEAIIK